MKHVLAFALFIGAGSLFATAAYAEPPDHARNDDAGLHPAHQGHLSSGREYPGRPDEVDGLRSRHRNVPKCG
ncbi:hypothetical protein, partial [Mesorhizobium sp.]|uniref:hypothetical protein n=1 Tax=Mesorhizobium sp. TaxID=1871066 RepID=UPI00257CD871